MQSKTQKLKIAIIGVGNLGQHHTRIYLSLKDKVEIVGVVDTNESALEKVCKMYHVSGYKNYEDVLDKVDAVSLVVPTSLHYRIGKEILASKKHLLIEKPITTTVEEAEELISIAEKNDLILQVGHVERFNPVVSAVKNYIYSPEFIESYRLGIFDKRVADVGVVLDLMIHDIDIVLYLVNSKLESVESFGSKVFSLHEDIVKARLKFENGCVCDLTASRISFGRYRTMRVFQRDSYISIDFLRQKTKIYKKSKPVITSPDEVEMIKPKITKEEPLKLELIHFVDVVLERKQPSVSGIHARDALSVAMEILKQLKLR